MKHNHLNFLFTLLLLFTMCGSAISCSDKVIVLPAEEELPEAGTLQNMVCSPETISIYEGQTAEVKLCTTPQDFNIDGAQWKTRNKQIASIHTNEDGTATIKAEGIGSTTIYAVFKEFRPTCAITVKKAPVELEAIDLVPRTLNLNSGEEAQIKANIIPEDAQLNSALKWETLNEEVATVDNQGKVKAVGTGSTKIKVSSGDIEAFCSVYVNTKNQKKTFTFYQLNIWEGLSRIKANKGLEAFINQLVELKPDVASFCEFPSPSHAERILSEAARVLKQRTGIQYYYNYYNHGSGVQYEGTRGMLSRHPFVEEKSFRHTWFYGNIIDFNGTEIAVYASHACPTNYACYLPRGYNDGSREFPYSGVSAGKLPRKVTTEEILQHEHDSGHYQIAEALVEDMQKQKARGRLSVFGGDLNEPSHFDWTDATKNLFDHNGYVIKWDISSILTQAGIKDSFRELYPDPVQYPGITWPIYNKDATQETQWIGTCDERDRIDFVYYMPDRQWVVKSAQMVGPTATRSYGRNFEDSFTNKAEQIIDPTNDIWPSDHRGLFITFEVETVK